MQHEGDEMKVAYFPQSSRLLEVLWIPKISMNTASNQQVPLLSRSGEVISPSLLSVFMEASDIQRS